LIVEPESELVEEVSVLVLGVWDDLEVLLNVVLGNLRVVVEALNFTLEVIGFSLDIRLELIELVLEEGGERFVSLINLGLKVGSVFRDSVNESNSV
jgi:hypothetical protein